MRIRVLLPAPFEPTSPMTPGSKSRSSRSSARTLPYLFVSPRVWMSGTATA